MRGNASPPGERLDPRDNTTGLPIDPDHPDAYQLPDEVIEVHGEMPPAAIWAYLDPEGYLQSLKGEHQWAQTATENELRHSRLQTTHMLMRERGYPRSEAREKIDSSGDRFILERYGYVENDGRGMWERQDNQNRIIEAINRYMDDYGGPATTQAQMGNADASDKAEAHAQYYSLALEGQQSVNSSVLASIAGAVALWGWDDPSDQNRVTGTVGFVATVEGLFQQHWLLGPGARGGGPKQQGRPPRERGRRAPYDPFRPSVRARLQQTNNLVDHSAPAEGPTAPAAITRDSRARATFENLEIRGMRDMSHVSESTLRQQAKRGFATKDPMNPSEGLVLHHLDQSPFGPVIEMPATRHDNANPRQHPFGNLPGAGLASHQRADFNAWARGELLRRGLSL
jgi:hypothetical protein